MTLQLSMTQLALSQRVLFIQGLAGSRSYLYVAMPCQVRPEANYEPELSQPCPISSTVKSGEAD
jgi:hypothetical protein